MIFFRRLEKEEKTQWRDVRKVKNNWISDNNEAPKGILLRLKR